MSLDRPNKDLSMACRVMPDQNTDYRIVVLGSAGVGKTSCVLRFVNGQFRENYIPTVEDTYRQVMSSNKHIITLEITDTTGTHQFPAMQRLSIQKGHAFILVYSITSRQTFEELKPIYDQIQEIKADQSNETPILLMGCKLDEAECREVTESLAKQLATCWSCAWIETSAKTNTNVREAFQELLKLEKKRQFNFNADQDGHLIEDNNSGVTSFSSSLYVGKRSIRTNSNSSPISYSGSSANMTETTAAGAVQTRFKTTILHRNKSSRTSIMSMPGMVMTGAKKDSQSSIEQTNFSDNSSRPKKSLSSDTSSNRLSARKCLIM